MACREVAVDEAEAEAKVAESPSDTDRAMASSTCCFT